MLVPSPMSIPMSISSTEGYMPSILVDSPMSIPTSILSDKGTIPPEPSRRNTSDILDISESPAAINQEDAIWLQILPLEPEYGEGSFNLPYGTPGMIGDCNGEPPFFGQNGDPPEWDFDSPYSPAIFPDELVRQMIKYCGVRYRCRQCEDWDFPERVITSRGLLATRVHIIDVCSAAPVKLKTRLLGLQSQIDRTQG